NPAPQLQSFPPEPRMNTSYVSTVPTYPQLASLLRAAPGTPWESHLEKSVIPYLTSVWLRHYRMSLSGGDIVEVPLGQYSYLFDIGPDRLIAAWGISRGRFAGDRPNSRIAGHPVANRNIYDAGHAISHRLGGGTDINLAAQLASVNRKAFQELERAAVKSPGSLYFTYWMYHRTEEKKVQRASRIQQGLIAQNATPQIRDFKN
ncbi:MAG TPA: hypothetical protein VG675_19615, partial [Bryobacteraceae bacterium]|nr:hypothetical protein [Bryobacteraceae bacterium]